MDGEMKNFGIVWVSVILSLCYCYAAGKVTHSGKIRFASVLPVISLFLLLPMNLSSVHLGGMTSFFIAWLANFKLLLFAFNQGPLSTDPSISLPRFIAVACLPIKLQQPAPVTVGKPTSPPKKGHKSPLNYTTKVLLLALLTRAYDYNDLFHPKFILILYCFHIYFSLEVVLAMVAAVARKLFEMELEPQFNDPYLSTSLQDFWGRRWNLMVTSILRPSVYEPVLSVATRVIGRRWAPLPAVFGTFLVSALMHEIVFYHFGRLRPSWELTWFFVLHGLSLMVEVGIKKMCKGRWRLPVFVSTPLTIAFVVVTGLWLFFPPLLRCKSDVRALEEYAAVYAFAKDVVGQALTSKALNGTSAA